MKVALVHDDFMQWGGAERVVAAWAEMFPDAPVFTVAVDPKVVAKSGIAPERFMTGWVDRIPFKSALNKVLFPLYPQIFEGFDFSGYDVVLSSSARFAHSIVTKPETVHISYVHSPFRGFWDPRAYFGDSVKGRFYRWVLQPLLLRMRGWDYIAGQRADAVVGNSKEIVRRVNKYWRREADVIYPFVDLDRFSHAEKPPIDLPEEYYVVVTRLVEWKRVDIVVQAFNQLKKHLLVIGSGTDKHRLQSMAGDTVHFPGFLTDEQLTYVLSNAKALIHPQKEDFGMTIPEAHACGTPVIAFNQGGALETLITGTGIFFEQQTSEAVVEAVKSFETQTFDTGLQKENAKRFDRDAYINNWNQYVEKYR